MNMKLSEFYHNLFQNVQVQKILNYTTLLRLVFPSCEK